MPQPASAPIEDGVIDVLKNVSRRPIEPSLSSDLVADLGFDSLQILEVDRRTRRSVRHLDSAERRAGHPHRRRRWWRRSRAWSRIGRKPDGPIAHAAGSAGASGAVPTRATVLLAATAIAGDRTPSCSRPRVERPVRCAQPACARGDLVGAGVARRRTVPDDALRRVDRRPDPGVDLSALDDERSVEVLRADRRHPACVAAPAPLSPAGRWRRRSRRCAGSCPDLHARFCAPRASTATGCEPDWRPSLDDIAFVQFTSGSTAVAEGRGADPPESLRQHRRVHRAVRPWRRRPRISASAGCRCITTWGWSAWRSARSTRRARACCCRPSRSSSGRPSGCGRSRATAPRSASRPTSPTTCASGGSRIVDRRLDLSCWRVAGCGAEPIHPPTLAAFAEQFAAAGFRDTSFLPCYGLAEHVLAATFPPRGRRPRTERRVGRRADRAARRRARTTATARRWRWSAAARALPGHQLQIVGEDGRPAGGTPRRRNPSRRPVGHAGVL